MNNLVLLQHVKRGIETAEVPPALSRYVPVWPNSHTETYQYPFGNVATVSYKYNHVTCVCRSTQLFHKQEKFTTALSKSAVIFHIRIKGSVNISVKSHPIHTIPEATMHIGYIPQGNVESEWEQGLGLTLITDITTLLEGYAPHSYQIQQLIQHFITQPDTPLALPAVSFNFWETGIIHLLLNLGKDAQHIPSFSQCIDQLIRLYLIHMHDDLPAAAKDRLCFEIVTGQKAEKTFLMANTTEGKLYNAIESYLLSHLKTHFKKEEVAQAMHIGEKEFVKLFKDGYGKPYREGYLELRMQKAFELVIQEQDKKLYSIARSVGYNQQSAFGERFIGFYGYPPTLFRWPLVKTKRPIVKQRNS